MLVLRSGLLLGIQIRDSVTFRVRIGLGLGLGIGLGLGFRVRVWDLWFFKMKFTGVALLNNIM